MFVILRSERSGCWLKIELYYKKSNPQNFRGIVLFNINITILKFGQCGFVIKKFEKLMVEI